MEIIDYISWLSVNFHAQVRSQYFETDFQSRHADFPYFDAMQSSYPHISPI